MTQNSRPVILVDLDNVTYGWAEAMRDWLNHNGVIKETTRVHQDGSQVSRYMDEYRNWEVWEDWGIPKGEFLRWWRLGIEAGEVYRKGPVIPGARNALWRLSDAEWDIHIATSRLTKFGLHDQIILNTATWLRDNNIPYRNIHFTDNKIAVSADAIVDDRVDHMSAAQHNEPFLFPANHNQGRFVTASEQQDAWEKIVNALVS